jgi:hypothetical protein
MASQDRKTAADIEQDVAQTRGRMDETLEALQHKMSPGQLVDQVLKYTRGGPGEYFSGLGQTIKYNPVPVALVGIGLAWLMMSDSKGSRRDVEAKEEDWEDYYPEEDYGDYEDYAYQPTDIVHEDELVVVPGAEAEERGLDQPAPMPGEANAGVTPSERVKPFGEEEGGEEARESAAKDKIGQAKRKVGEGIGRAQVRSSKFAQSARSGMSRASGGARRSAASARRGAGRMGSGARRQAMLAKSRGQQLLFEQPLVLGALGIALGAALGAAMPSTRREDEMMGEKRDELIGRTRQMGAEQAQRAQRTAAAAGEAARDEAERQGLTREGAEQQIDEAREKVEKVVDAAREAAEKEVDKQRHA